MIVIGSAPVNEKSKQQELKKVPTRKLLASLKLDIRRTMRASASASKPKQK
jgi:hypothetical protein